MSKDIIPLLREASAVLFEQNDKRFIGGEPYWNAPLNISKKLQKYLVPIVKNLGKI